MASLGDRLWGQIVDEVVAIAIFVFGVVAARFLPGINAVGIVAAILYLLLSDGFRAGQSYGKMAAKTAVVDATTGQPCTYLKSFQRNLMLHLFGLIDWIFIFGDKRQRLGDKVANTIVIEKPWAVRGKAPASLGAQLQ